jgi:hypothetical protein
MGLLRYGVFLCGVFRWYFYAPKINSWGVYAVRSDSHCACARTPSTGSVKRC